MCSSCYLDASRYCSHLLLCSCEYIGPASYYSVVLGLVWAAPSEGLDRLVGAWDDRHMRKEASMATLCKRCNEPVRYPDGVYLRNGVEIHRACVVRYTVERCIAEGSPIIVEQKEGQA